VKIPNQRPARSIRPYPVRKIWGEKPHNGLKGKATRGNSPGLRNYQNSAKEWSKPSRISWTLRPLGSGKGETAVHQGNEMITGLEKSGRRFNNSQISHILPCGQPTDNHATGSIELNMLFDPTWCPNVWPEIISRRGLHGTEPDRLGNGGLGYR